MAVRAKISSTWLIRMLLMVVVFLGFGLYGAYDGLVRYPARNTHWKVYREFDKANPNADSVVWEEYAEEKGVSTDLPKTSDTGDADKPPHDEGDLRTQFIYMAGGLVIGGVALIVLLINWRRVLIADDEKFVSEKGVKVPYDAVKGIDKSRWEKKFIAVVNYEIDGVAGSAKIDDWKYKGGAAVLAAVEEHVNIDG